MTQQTFVHPNPIEIVQTKTIVTVWETLSRFSAAYDGLPVHVADLNSR